MPTTWCAYILKITIPRFAVVLSLLVVTSVCTQAQTAREELQVRETLSRFVRAFDDLDWETFRLTFDDGATVFYPRAFPERATGRAEFEKIFRTVFEQIRGSKTSAPYMDIQPREMKIQLFGNLAIATFHLDDRAGFVNRRTIVLNKNEHGWKIVLTGLLGQTESLSGITSSENKPQQHR